MLAKSATRVPEHISEGVNESIRHETHVRVAHRARHPNQMDDRLRPLDAESDIQRVLATGLSTLALSRQLLAFAVDRKLLLLSLGVQALSVQHALRRWCPPLPVFPRLGVRTQTPRAQGGARRLRERRIRGRRRYDRAAGGLALTKEVSHDL